MNSQLGKRCGVIVLALTVLLVQGLALGHGSAGRKTVEEAYPGLATGVLKFAKLADLDQGVLLEAEGLRIRGSDITRALESGKPHMREQLAGNLFFLLEQQAMQGLLLQMARKSGQGQEPDNRAVMRHLNEQSSEVSVSQEEVKQFYEKNRDAVGGATFKQVQVGIYQHLLQQKKNEAIKAYVDTLGQRIEIAIDAEWVKRQNGLARDNPVDRARSSGTATLVEFGATGCKPCDMMQPILESLRKKYQDRLNIIFVHVREEEILGARYGINAIPVQVFYDEAGREMFRHTGFYPQAEIEKRLALMGVE